MEFSDDGEYLVSGSWDKTVRLWRVSREEYVKILQGHSGPVRSVAFSGDGNYLASGSADNSIELRKIFYYS